MLSTAAFSGINEKAIFSIWTFAQANAGLFLARKALAKEIPVPDLLDGIVGFYIQQLANALTNLFPARNRV
jgi:hypothetical protein